MSSTLQLSFVIAILQMFALWQASNAFIRQTNRITLVVSNQLSTNKNVTVFCRGDFTSMSEKVIGKGEDAFIKVPKDGVEGFSPAQCTAFYNNVTVKLYLSTRPEDHQKCQTWCYIKVADNGVSRLDGVNAKWELIPHLVKRLSSFEYD